MSTGTVRLGRIFSLLVACALLLAPAGSLRSASPPPREITFDERVEAQKAIERVYYSHQIGATQPFDEAVPRDLIEKKVRAYLRQSAALDSLWGTPVTAGMLRRETERIAASTRLPERLAEIHAALGNDPFLIQECFARPTLVERLTRDFFASDRRYHAAARREAEDLRGLLVKGRIDPRSDHPARTVQEIVRGAPGAEAAPGTGAPSSPTARRDGSVERLLAPADFSRVRERAPKQAGEIGAVEEEREAFVVRAVLGEDAGRAEIATWSVPKRSWDDWWAEVEPDFDDRQVAPVAGPLEGALVTERAARPACAPAAEGSAPAGLGSGVQAAAPFTFCDLWENGILGEAEPDGRTGHTAVWTGSLMIVWGGIAADEMATGGRYDPLTNTWTPTSLSGAPLPRRAHTAVWSGSEMIVWGGLSGSSFLNSGGVYDPISDRWSPTSTAAGSPVPRYGHTAVWVSGAGVMVVWGGEDSRGAKLNTGGLYDPSTDTWQATNQPDAPQARSLHTAVTSGSIMIVWGGFVSATGLTNSGAIYDARGDTWKPTVVATGVPSPRFGHSAVTTGSSMIIWGGTDASNSPVATGSQYDPVGNRWAAVSATGAPAARSHHTAVWSGAQMIVWGGQGATQRLDDGGRYNPTLNAWGAISTTNAPTPRRNHTAVWTGNLMLVWGGEDAKNVKVNSGGRYALQGNAWSPTASAGGPSARHAHTAVWTGNLMIVWGGNTKSDQITSTGSRYNPTTDSWLATSLSNAPTARANHTAVWTGSVMVIWGGSLTNTGGRYNPLTNSWADTSLTNAPTARSNHTAVWTGSLMIVWGGQDAAAGCPCVNSGGRYNPVTDLWSPTSPTNAPPGSRFHTAVWTGSQMIVWGGDGSVGGIDTGGRYSPGANAWASVSTTNAPVGRFGHTAVWSGSDMVIWGGRATGAGWLNTGGRYDPVLNSWLGTTLTDAPEARSGHTAIMTEVYMVVWGGIDVNTALDTGAHYDPFNDVWIPLSGIGAPAPRHAHTAVLADTRILIWGGAGSNPLLNFHNDGGRYVSIDDTDSDGDGFSVCTGDCDDGQSEKWPGNQESCDNLDNDCDGTVDSFPTSCGFGECAATGTCTAGVDTCVEGNPSQELCDNLDNDCDGTPDEFGTTCGVGACFAFGYCSAGFDSCIPGTPTTETCDDTDNNCDGSVDENNPEGGNPCDTGLPGICAGGITECQGGGFLACVQTVFPDVEVCDNVDNDCDGIPDEFGTTCGEGACATTGFCSGGFDSCIPQSPLPEVCNDFDDNCDGQVDEGNPGGGAACSTGNPGICDPGRITCVGGSLTCVPDIIATPETCNNADDNCDGQVDEGNPGGGAPCATGLPGVCAAGTSTCQAGSFSCVQNLAPTPEVCDNLDNNCDGTVDSFTTSCGTGACARAGVCTAGVNVCTPGQPASETCNNIDDNCDGTVDSFATSCGLGQCARTGTCTAGVNSCTPGAPSAETCNNADDNCNGQVDDGNPGGGAACATGLLGACGVGTTTCASGSLGCVANVTPTAEACDNVDNDCDGTVDAYATTCGAGPCASTGSCTAGIDTCTAGVPSAEICDGADNDCDGSVDDLVGADPDLDGFDSGCDNCPAAYNPDQENTDGDAEGGDGCDITVTYPLAGDVSCPSLPPTITWSPENWTHFKVFVGWSSNFRFKFTSGKKLLTGTSWTPPTTKWNLACAGANPNVYIKVKGKVKGQRGSEESEVTIVPVK